MPQCRVCLNNLPVCLYLNDEKGLQVEKMLSDLTGMQQLFILPETLSHICYRCYCDVKFAYSIQQKTIKSQERLLEKTWRLGLAKQNNKNKKISEIKNPPNQDLIINNNNDSDDGSDIEVESIKNIKLSLNLNEYQCKICGDDNDDYQDLLNHVGEHFRGPQICVKCERVFLSMTSYRRHVSQRHRHGDIWECPHCEMKFRYVTFLQIHEKSVHSFTTNSNDLVPISNIRATLIAEPPTTTMCDVCGLLIEKKKFYKHTRKHMPIHNDKIKNIMCEACGEMVSRNAYWKHNKRHTGKAETCRICGNTYSNIVALRQHQRIYHERVEKRNKPVPCKICGKQLSGGNLRKHIRQHLNDKRHECELCGEKFLHKFLFRRHKRVKHLIMEEETSECQICLKTFTDDRALYTHMARVH